MSLIKLKSGGYNAFAVDTIRNFAESAADGTSASLRTVNSAEATTITISANNCVLDFGGSKITRSAGNNYGLRVTGSGNTIRNLVFDGDNVAAGGARNEGIRVSGSGNVIENCTVKNIPVSGTADGFVSLQDTTWLRCHGQDVGNAIFNVWAGAIIDQCTGHFTAATASVDYGTSGRPRWMIGGAAPYSYDTITVRNSTFTSVGAWGRCVIDAEPDANRLANLIYENVTFDNRGAAFNAYATSPNLRSFHKFENIETIRWDGVTFLHDQAAATMPMKHFVKCGSLICDDVQSDSYIVLFSESGGGLQNITLRDSAFGVNAPIRRLIDIGPESSNWDTDVVSVTISNVTASNITDSYGLYARTHKSSTWGIVNLTLNFENPGGQLAESNANATITATNVEITP